MHTLLAWSQAPACSSTTEKLQLGMETRLWWILCSACQCSFDLQPDDDRSTLSSSFFRSASPSPPPEPGAKCYCWSAGIGGNLDLMGSTLWASSRTEMRNIECWVGFQLAENISCGCSQKIVPYQLSRGRLLDIFHVEVLQEKSTLWYTHTWDVTLLCNLVIERCIYLYICCTSIKFYSCLVVQILRPSYKALSMRLELLQKCVPIVTDFSLCVNVEYDWQGRTEALGLRFGVTDT